MNYNYNDYFTIQNHTSKKLLSGTNTVRHFVFNHSTFLFIYLSILTPKKNKYYILFSHNTDILIGVLFFNIILFCQNVNGLKLLLRLNSKMYTPQIFTGF